MKLDASQRVPAMLSFVQAADRGSFVAAARALGITAAAVSKNIATLEVALGVRLMNRTTRSLQLTSEGEVFLERARTAINALDDAIDAIAVQRNAPVGQVRISTSNAFGKSYLLPLMPELHRRHPQLKMEIDFDDRWVDIVRDGYDLAIRGGQPDDSSLVARRLFTLSTVMVASPDYLARCGVPTTVDQLAAHQLISLRFLNRQVASWWFYDARRDVIEYTPPSPALVVSSPDATVTAAVMGMGITQAGVHHVWRYLREGKLKVILADCHHPGAREMSLQYPHRALMAPRVRATVDYLLQEFARMDELHVRPEACFSYCV